MRFGYETRLHAHERHCSGLRDFWHIVTGEHILIARWDYEESSFVLERVLERYLGFLKRSQDALSAKHGGQGVE